MKKLTITSSAKRDLKETWAFIAKDNPVAAARGTLEGEESSFAAGLSSDNLDISKLSVLLYLPTIGLYVIPLKNIYINLIS